MGYAILKIIGIICIAIPIAGACMWVQMELQARYTLQKIEACQK